jgi:uncharacterized protein
VVEPTSPRDREPTLDVLRGFAMLGVLLANLYSLYSLRFVTMGGVRGDGTLDTAASWFMTLAVQGKAQTLLTCLFGFGFAAQLLRAQARGEPVFAMYVRRLIALFVLGWLHVLLLAWVDVTWGYALVGFFLLAFLTVSNRTRVIAAIVCMVVPSVLYAFPSVRPAVHGLLFDRPPPAYMMEFVGAARGDDWLAMAKQNAVMGTLWMLGGNVLWYVPWLLGRFLLGYVVGAKRWFEGPRLDVFRKLLVIGVAAAVPGLILQVFQLLRVIDPRGSGTAVKAALAVIHEVTVVAQVAVYVALVVLLMQRPLWRRVLGVLAPVGRMPLTTYLMQSAICPVLFYGWGLGWQTPRPAASVGLACAIFVGQVLFAHLWLRWFRFGPAEWLWRTVVYLRAQPMRV